MAPLSHPSRDGAMPLLLFFVDADRGFLGAQKAVRWQVEILFWLVHRQQWLPLSYLHRFDASFNTFPNGTQVAVHWGRQVHADCE